MNMGSAIYNTITFLPDENPNEKRQKATPNQRLGRGRLTPPVKAARR
ncbi:hypothetical protein GEOBRER4_n3727 [Citrifermentans bremense]|uniref:Uncharacterized protein n=1 Tax=Citrifermentans bremense TaxID=60035 RepID=A0A7R7FT82_9BACT|nr:hypothetical protein GEOBRER4_n3727 [Citrifermentans bremense]